MRSTSQLNMSSAVTVGRKSTMSSTSSSNRLYQEDHFTALFTLMSVHSCVQPANARLSTKSKAGGVCSSLREVQFRRASRPMRLTALASRSCCSCEQCAKVPPKISLISVCEMSTIRNLLQCSHAAGPIQLKKAGKNNDSIPASKKQPSGMERFKLVGSYSVLSKLSCCKVLHFSKARGRNRACGAS